MTGINESISEWHRVWNVHMSRIDDTILVKIARDNESNIMRGAGGYLRRRWHDRSDRSELQCCYITGHSLKIR